MMTLVLAPTVPLALAETEPPMDQSLESVLCW